jgi:hypothetical protein
VPRSVLEAVKMGDWNFEPPAVDSREYSWTEAMPGTQEKVDILAERARSGLPLWHPRDRFEVDKPGSLGSPT